MSGVPVTILGLPSTGPTAADSVPVWDSETGLTGRFTLAQLQTLFAATFALVAGQVFTGNISAPAVFASVNDNGTGSGGPVTAARNSNASTPAPGYVNLQRPNSSTTALYSDDAQLIRILNTAPTNANMASGTVVGTQTSSLAQKDLLPRELLAIDEVLAAINMGAAAVRPFIYKAPVDYDGEGNLIEGMRPMGGEEFEGVIIDYAPRYAMDHDESNPEGKSLNEINIFGDLLRAVDWLVGQNDAMKARLAVLEGD